jgi:hypothetical protein
MTALLSLDGTDFSLCNCSVSMASSGTSSTTSQPWTGCGVENPILRSVRRCERPDRAGRKGDSRVTTRRFGAPVDVRAPRKGMMR